MAHGSYSRALIAVTKLRKPFVRSGSDYKTISTYHFTRTNIGRLVCEALVRRIDEGLRRG
ncbi:hypothetical protein PILCRDRAFT_827467 [Piloderma croceum F 1598]|uniref:Uncharacterized protein n=1 Tax=Piloderma croceum (strain F 1598) TaxID=765440 RepID=A0A0C3AMV8_PILCF|nr:hypothetical protein PILCRDRAFT_827467 [Piloderma croceum F 1598]